ncbi:MAG: TlpA disulfide reductase family protein [Candidatus Cloacimonadaceae bacterium]
MRKLILILALVAISTWLLAVDTMPDFRLPNMEGKNLSLESLLGKGPVLIDFWADFCAPCKTAMPYLDELAQKYEELSVVMISIDAPKTQMRAKSYLKSKNYKFISLFDADKALAKKLNVGTPPHSFILNPAGEIVFSHVGFEPGLEKEYEAKIEEIISQIRPIIKPDPLQEQKKVPQTQAGEK